MIVAINNQTAGCFTFEPVGDRAQEFARQVLNGVTDYNLAIAGWDRLKELGCYQPRYSGNWASVTDQPLAKHVKLAM